MAKKSIEITGEIVTESTKTILTKGLAVVLTALLPETIPFWLTAIGITGKVALDVIGNKIKEKFHEKEGFFNGINNIYQEEVESKLKKGIPKKSGFNVKYEHFKRYYEICNEKSDEIIKKCSNEDGIVNYLSSATIDRVISSYCTGQNINKDYVTEIADEIIKDVDIKIRDNNELAPTYLGIKNCENYKELAEKLDYKNSFAEYIDNLELPSKFSSKENRFHYLNSKIEFHGRKNELNQIKNFLSNNDNMKVWVICGQGGVGKSKFARHICDTLADQYKFIWLTDSDLKKIPEISGKYSYDRTLVFVCDYADERINELYKLIQKMFDSNLKSRFILLVRNTEWYNRELCINIYSAIKETAYNSRTEGNRTIYEPLDLSANPLDEAVYKNIIKDFKEAFYHDEKLKEEEIKEIIENSNKIVPSNSMNQRASRCLFLLMIADSYLINRKFDFTSNDVISDFFSRTKEHLTNIYGQKIVNVGFRLVAFSTATKGLDLLNDKNLPKFIIDDKKKIFEHFDSQREKIKKFFSNLTDTVYDKDTLAIKPYEPDILGEYLFLSEWKNYTERESWCDYLREQAENNSAIMLFVSRCLADWEELGLEFFLEMKK